MLILLAGTPGTGKSSLASLLVRRFGLVYRSLTEIVLYNRTWVEYDWNRRSFIIDVMKTRQKLAHTYRNLARLVLETHDVSIVWEAGLEPYAILVLRTRPSILYRRLVRRGWPLRKIAENLEAELVGVVAYEARILFGEQKVCELDTSRISTRDVFKISREYIETGMCPANRIDWLEYEDEARFVARLSQNV